MRPTHYADEPELRIYDHPDINLGLDDMTIFIVFTKNAPYVDRESLLCKMENQPTYNFIGYSVFLNNISSTTGGFVRSLISDGATTLNNSSGSNVYDGQFKLAEIRWDRDKFLEMYNTQGSADAPLVWINSFENANIDNTYFLYIGANRITPKYFDGQIAEILIYKRLLHDYERNSIRDYLNYKYTGSAPVQCGDEWTQYSAFDFDNDCYVDMKDFAIFAQQWLVNTDPAETE